MTFVLSAATSAPNEFSWVYILYLVLATLLGGGATSLYNSIKENKRADSQAKAMGLKTPAEVEQIHVSGMEILIGRLQEDNGILRKDRDYWKAEYDKIKQQVDEMAQQIDQYRLQIHELQQAMDRIVQGSPAKRAGVE